MNSMYFDIISKYDDIIKIINSNKIDDRNCVINAQAYINSLIKHEDRLAINDNKSLSIAIWFLRCIDEPQLTSRFLIDQRDIFKNYIMKTARDEDFPDLIRNLGIPVFINGNNYKMDFSFFVSYNKRISGYKYRLVYQSLDHGYINLDIETFSNIMREYIVSRLLDIYNSIDKDQAIKAMNNYINKIESMRREFKESIRKYTPSGKIRWENFPPCIKAYINEINDGGNPAHLARLTLATFLHHIGMPNDEIVKVFSGTADFDENSATYQVNHLTGKISGTEYSPPKCDTLRSNHLCFMDDDPLCRQVKHPLQYYMKKRSH
ncbi:DNA primase regulatory subunit PriL [Picrophilus oshimae]|uniref:DNA primase large subunit PriL n=1 Tax=Picrophilus torridus (strain ATCC 700027 / DSM 9790 / JCM 10055 / NBRC 100828 / KAW 2/3) TaxID=1122961 RepID=Q6L0D5_PICTO|nr:DNA primase regulatory subunit PriL [Picrophilus oshimae]AAT43567.1 DNA primase 58 kDa subunit [Picrophilus oshimae DSM 9789]